MGGGDAELARLREAERRLRLVTAQAPDFILEFDRAGTISYMNRPAPGHTPEDMLGSNVRKWMEPAYREAFGEAVAQVFDTREPASYESVGSVTGRYYVNRISPVVIEGQVISAVLITHDVTELKKAEQNARDAEERYRALVEASFEGLVISVDRVFMYGNRAVADMFGYEPEEMLGLTPAQLATPESAALIARNVAAGLETPYEVTCIRRDGTTFPCELLGRNSTHEGKPARITGFRDLTERRRREREQERREERVRHAQKLETLGVLAGGIAHDFNNLLTIVLANADSARRGADDRDRLAHNLDQIHKAVERARELTAQLLVYAGQGEHQTERIDVSQLLDDALELLRVSISKKARMECELAPNLPQVECDVGQLRQIAMNLLLNASESLAGAPGVITLATGVLEADAAYLDRTLAYDDVEPGTFVYIEVCDTGAGMDVATLERVFDPFYSTKPAGRGLGLASVQGIVRAHHGAIDVRSEPNKGTRFRVLFPAVHSPETIDAPAEPAASPAQTGTGTVLVAEDEPAIADIVQLALEDAGCHVFTAADGEQAVALFARHADTIDVVLLDLTMPKMNGVEALAAIRQTKPGVPALLCSGYSASGYDKIVENDEDTGFLPKPYALDELLERVLSLMPKR